jgi:hypothetical protein
MSDEENTENLIRYVRLREALNPVPIFVGDPPEPISVHWMGIAQSVSKTHQLSDTRVSYLVMFYGGADEVLECLQFEMLDSLGPVPRYCRN